MSDIEHGSKTSPDALAAEIRELRAETGELRADLAGLRRRRRRSRLAMIGGATAAAALVGGGVAFAVIPDAGTGVIHGCYDNTSGALRVIDPSTQSCLVTESALNWNMTGVNWRGKWNTTSSYAVNDAVSYNGSSYIAITANTDKRPPGRGWATLSSGTVFDGAWSASKQYYPGAVVSYSGGSYLATKSSKGDAPTDTFRWNVLAGQGQPGSDGASVLNGSGAPDDSVGADGDFYIDTAANVIYGPKTGGSWPASGNSLIGPKGDTGAAGPGSTVISMTITSGDEFDQRDFPNSDLSADWSCEAGEPVFDGITVSEANFNLYAADAPGLQLSGVNTSTGNSDIEAGASTSTQPFYPVLSFPKNGVFAFNAGYDTASSPTQAQIEISTEPAQGDAGATYSHFTLVHGSTGATLDLYLAADNTGTPSCTVEAIITPTSQ